MWLFSLNELADILLITLLASALVYAFWLRSNMSKSKASFALSIVAAMTAGSAAYVKFVSGPEVPVWATILNSTLEKTGVIHPFASTSAPTASSAINWIAEILTFGLYIVLLVCIYKIGKSTIEKDP